jgi:uncharacterized membrane protein YecN with MAPEG domain
MSNASISLCLLLLGMALMIVGAGIYYAYGQVRGYRPEAVEDQPPAALVDIIRLFVRGAVACLVLGLAAILAAAVMGIGEISSMARIPVSLVYAALLSMLLLVLTYNVLHHKVRALLYNFGAEDALCERIVRVHANFTEYVPTGLALLILIDWAGAPAALVHCGGGLLTLGRCLHAWGYSVSGGAHPGRIFGIQLTLLALAFMVVTAAYFLIAG